MGRPVGAGVAPITTVDGVGTVVAIPKQAKRYWVLSSGAAWIDTRNSGAADASVSAADANAIGAGLYGPFDIMRTYDTHIVVAGNGGTPTVTLTFET